MTKPNQLQHTMTYYLFHSTSQTFDTMLSNHKFPSINSWMKSPALHQCGSELPQSNFGIYPMSPFFGGIVGIVPPIQFPTSDKFSVAFPIFPMFLGVFTRVFHQGFPPVPALSPAPPAAVPRTPYVAPPAVGRGRPPATPRSARGAAPRSPGRKGRRWMERKQRRRNKWRSSNIIYMYIYIYT